MNFQSSTCFSGLTSENGQELRGGKNGFYECLPCLVLVEGNSSWSYLAHTGSIHIVLSLSPAEWESTGGHNMIGRFSRSSQSIMGKLLAVALLV
jgi:hypothetical protein